MARRDLSLRDASYHAASELEYALTREKKTAAPAVPTISPEEAMRADRVVQIGATRDVTRVLFISQNTELLNPATQTLDGYINISNLFDEVHIVVMRQGIQPRVPVMRVAPNVWVYVVSAKLWWWIPMAALKMIQEQMVFATGFRPDLVIARDPFESAFVAIKIAKKYSRPMQLHVLEDYTHRAFLRKARHNFWRRFMPRFTLPYFASVRTQTNSLQVLLQKKRTFLNIDTLPRYQSYEALIDIPKTVDLKDKYQPFVFIMLFVGKLSHESTLHVVIDAARGILRNPRVGLVVLGDGPSRGEFEKRAKVLGIHEQVVFETRTDDVVPYLKSANLLVVSDTDRDSEDLVLKGAAAGIPMVMSCTHAREDVFIEGESAYFCESGDTEAFTNRINDVLNDVSIRNTFIKNGQAMIRSRFHDDPAIYQEAYRASIEEALFVGDSEIPPA